jgi:hypothetical protein
MAAGDEGEVGETTPPHPVRTNNAIAERMIELDFDRIFIEDLRFAGWGWAHTPL